VKLRISLEGKTYDVDVEVVEEQQNSAPAPITLPKRPPRVLPEARVGARRRPEKPDPKICRSPFAGMVVSVLVSVGQPVKAEEPLLVLEAMKMESTVLSQIAGVVKAVHVKAGDAVKPGQVLVELE
jgi:biotin carboxyl carrier protein